MWNDIRNNTNFITQMAEFFRAQKSDNFLHYHQYLIDQLFAKYELRGLLIMHKMGLGKSLTSAAVCARLLKQGYEAIFVAAKTLHVNFRETIDKYEELSGECFGNIKYVSLNASNMYDQISKASLHRLEEQLAKKHKKTAGNLDNKVVIIDEAHNFFNSIANGSDNATRLYRLIMRSKCRLIFLSGSPIINDPFEIALCFNMLTGQVLFPEIYTEFTEAFVDGESIKNEGKFINRIFGLVSYFSAENEFAKLLPRELKTKIVVSQMSPKQLLQYKSARKIELESQLRAKRFPPKVKALQKTQAFNASYRVASRQFSNFSFPDYAVEHKRNDKGQLTYIENFDKLGPADVDKNLDKYSPKMHALLKNATSEKGIGLIYSQFLKFGIKILTMVLAQRGFKEYTLGSTVSGSHYAVISGEVPKKDVQEIIQIVNSAENKHGDIIRLLLITATAAEGVDLQNIRHIHILEPYWNWSRISQIIARGVRINSHKNLPDKDRTVKPFIYLSTHKDVQETTDQYLFKKMIHNQRLINSFYAALKHGSIDCQAHYQDCLTCPATNKRLFNPDLTTDLAEANPCQEGEVEAELFEKNGKKYAKYGDSYAIYNEETSAYEPIDYVP